VLCELLKNLAGALVQLFGKRQNGCFERSQRRVQVHHNADILLAIGSDVLFIIGITEESEDHAVAAERRFNHIRNIVLVRFGVEVFQRFAGSLLMAAKVIIGAVGNTPELAPVSKGESKLNIGGCAAINRERGRLVVAQAQMLLFNAERIEPFGAEVFPIGKPVKVGAGFAEEFAFHLLKFARAEGEVAGGDLIAERLANLADTERQLFAGGALNICKVHEDALRGFGAQITHGRRILGHAD